MLSSIKVISSKIEYKLLLIDEKRLENNSLIVFKIISEIFAVSSKKSPLNLLIVQ